MEIDQYFFKCAHFWITKPNYEAADLPEHLFSQYMLLLLEHLYKKRVILYK